MDTVTKTPESKTTIRFPDCDPFNHLNNARYIDYFMNAREDHLLDNYQFDLYEHTRQKGQSWVVTQNQIQYLRPASLKEEVIIQSVLLNFDKHSLLVEMTMWDKHKSQIKALLWSVFTYVDLKSQRRAIHDPELLSFFKELKTQSKLPKTFEERIDQLKEMVG